MPIKRVEQVGSFVALDDAGGKHTIDMFQHIIDVGDFQQPGAEVGGIKELRTRDGHHVNYKSKGEYEILELGLTVRSDAPDAP